MALPRPSAHHNINSTISSTNALNYAAVSKYGKLMALT